MIGSVIALIVLLVLFFLGNQKKAETPPEPGKRVLPKKIGAVGLYIESMVSRVFGKNREAETRLLLSKDERLRTAMNVYGGAWCIAVIGAVIGILVGISNLLTGRVTSLPRPEFGEIKTESLWVDGLEKRESIQIQISGRDPSEKEMDVVFDRTFADLKTEILGENPDFDHVYRSMNFVNETENGIRVNYQSDNPELISNFGILMTDSLPETAAAVTISLTMRYKEMEKSFELPIHVCSAEFALTELEKVEEAVRLADSQSVKEAEMVLPREIEGKKIRFEKGKTSPYGVLGIFFILAIGVIALLFEKRKEALKAREIQLENSYSKFLAKFSALLDAGMSTRSAWLKLADDYRRNRDGKTAKREYLMEEMLISANQFRSGVPEETVYLEFGRRIGQHRYVKFANTLTLSMRQGVSGMKTVLRDEMQTALEERKNVALKRGEEAGTKQLFPMLMMLGIVIVVLIIPAFMSL